MRAFKRVYYYLMVTMMKYLTRSMRRVAIPIVRMVANREIIACGLRVGGEVRAIYTQNPLYSKPYFHIASGNKQKVETVEIHDYSSGLVKQIKIPDTRIGERYRFSASSKNGRAVSSPVIEIKEETKIIDEYLNIKIRQGNEVRISWPKARKLGAMIYFLLAEDEEKRPLAGIYTRENYWIYPRVDKTPYAVGENLIKPLESGREYRVRLLLVDYEGWVSHMGMKLFLYRS